MTDWANMVLIRLEPQIPRILHSRCQLYYYRRGFDDGAHCIFLSSHTYPDLFRLRFQSVYRKSPQGWKQKPGREYQKYLWIPTGELDDGTIAEIDAWGERFKGYVLLGLNENLKRFFNDQLDFCLAVSFNLPEPGAERTVMGEAEYQLKYRSAYLSPESRQEYAKVLLTGTLQGFDDLPLPSEDVIISAVPANEEGQGKLAWKLAEATAKKKSCEFLSATLRCPKKSLKSLSFDEKIAEWKRLFATDGCVELSAEVTGKTVVVVDDLYQSGVTMWCYAEFLKSNGAKHVVGLVCVKSLRDTDNQ